MHQPAAPSRLADEIVSPFALARAIRVVRGILHGLAPRHSQGLAHGAVHPARVLLRPDGTVLLDGAQSMDHVGAAAACLSPEQAAGELATPRSDVYAAGCLLWWLLAGRPPFDAEDTVEVARMHRTHALPSLRDHRVDVPDTVLDVIDRATAKDPSRRLSSATDMDAALAATGIDAQDDATPILPTVRMIPPDPHSTTRTTRTSTTAAPPESAMTWWLVALGLLAVVAVLAGLAVVRSTRREAAPTPAPTPIVIQQQAPPPVMQPAPPPPPAVVVVERPVTAPPANTPPPQTAPPPTAAP